MKKFFIIYVTTLHFFLHSCSLNIPNDEEPSVNRPAFSMDSSFIPRKNIDEPVNICCFGSSWFMNTWWYLNKMMDSVGIKANLTCFFVGGAGFNQWIHYYNNNELLFYWQSSNGSDWTTGQGTFSQIINNKWDIIAFQQGAYQSIKWDEWIHYEDLLNIILSNENKDIIIAFNSTWTPPIHGNLSPYQNNEEGQRLWQINNNINTIDFLRLSNLKLVAPNGATMWSLRHDPDLNTYGDLATDSIHPDNGLPMYALAGTFFATYITPMYHIPVDNVDWIPDVSTPQAPINNGCWQSINNEQRDKIHEIINKSLQNPFGFN